MFPFAPSSLSVSHRGQSGGRGPSPRIWDRMSGQAHNADGGGGWYHIGDDFMSFGIGTAVSSNAAYYVSQAGAYKSYEDTGGTIAQSATHVGGVVEFTVDADDNQENWLTTGNVTGVLGKITSLDNCPMLFETRFQTSAVVGNIFLGLSEEALAAGDTITDAGAMADKDFIGFYVGEDAPTTLKFVYRKAGQAMQTVFSYGTAIAANTWYKVGFAYEPRAVASKRIKAFVDNVEQETYVTATNIAAATFPSGEELGFLAGHKNVTDITVLRLDWWHFAQQGN